MRYIKIILLLCIINNLAAQPFRIKAGVLAVPVNFAMVNVGAEVLEKGGNTSWQLYYAMVAGAVAVDAGETHRKWITMERTWYKGKKEKLKFSYSIFTEAGTRIKYPGYIHPPIDSIPKSWNYTEIAPGASIGFHFAFSKRLGLQAMAGPKLIIPLKGVQYLYNTTTRSHFTIAEHKNLQAGIRFSACLYYQFYIKKSSR